MIVKIPIEPVIGRWGIEYHSSEDELLSILAEMKCYPSECQAYEMEFLIAGSQDRKFQRSFYSFQRDKHPPTARLAESATITLYVPDDDPSALLVKLRWG